MKAVKSLEYLKYPIKKILATPEYLFRIYQALRLPKDFFMISLAAFIGTATALILVLYHHSITWLSSLLFIESIRDLESELKFVVKALIPAIGGLLIAVLFVKIKRNEKEYGAPAIIDAVVNHNGFLPSSIIFVTFIASVLCIATGGSVGKEGPSLLIGAGIASFIGQKMNLSGDRLRLLVGAGSAAGLAATFNVPIAGAIFALEIIMADFSIRAFSPIIISSVFATTISRIYIHDRPIFEITTYSLNSPIELIFYLILGILGGYVSVFIIRSHRWMHIFFKRKIKLSTMMKAIVGGLIVGVSALSFPEIYGFNDNAINLVLEENYVLSLTLILFILKIFMMHITLASGGLGGIFTPTLMIGAFYGLSFGHVINYLFPEIAAPAGAYAVVGMAVLTAGVQHAMLSAILLIFECTSDYYIMLPLMISVVPSIIISKMINQDSIYTMQFAFWGDRIARGRNIEILEKMHINDVYRKDVEHFKQEDNLQEIIKRYSHGKQSIYPVLDSQMKIIGTISLKDIREIMHDSTIQSLICAADFARTNIIKLRYSDDFETAFQKLDYIDLDSLPVINENDEFCGILFREDLMKQYRKELLFSTAHESQ